MLSTAFKSVLKVAKKLLPFANARNASLVLAVLSLFGVVAPETATRIRNDILVPLGAVTQGTGDLVNVGGE